MVYFFFFVVFFLHQQQLLNLHRFFLLLFLCFNVYVVCTLSYRLRFVVVQSPFKFTRQSIWKNKILAVGFDERDYFHCIIRSMVRMAWIFHLLMIIGLVCDASSPIGQRCGENKFNRRSTSGNHRPAECSCKNKEWCKPINNGAPLRDKEVFGFRGNSPTIAGYN